MNVLFVVPTGSWLHQTSQIDGSGRVVVGIFCAALLLIAIVVGSQSRSTPQTISTTSTTHIRTSEVKRSAPDFFG